jgi:hypothetical protein
MGVGAAKKAQKEKKEKKENQEPKHFCSGSW